MLLLNYPDFRINEAHITKTILFYDGDYGADYIELLNWLEQKQELCGWIIPTVFEIHSMNVVGAENMKRVIKHNNWKMN